MILNKKFLPVTALFVLMNTIGLYCIYFFPIKGIKLSFILVVNLMLFILVVLIIALSIKMAKYIIRNDVVNRFLVPENLGMMPGPNNYVSNDSMPPNSNMNMNMIVFLPTPQYNVQNYLKIPSFSTF